MCITVSLLTSLTLSGQSTGSKRVSVNLPEVALLDVEPAGTITLVFTKPSEAGDALTPPAINTTKWLNYSSAISFGGSHRQITAAVNATIEGVNLRLKTLSASGVGGGVLGTSVGVITLGTSPKIIISGIGGAYTGDGVQNGHQLEISATIDDYKQLHTQTNTLISIRYTIISN